MARNPTVARIQALNALLYGWRGGERRRTAPRAWPSNFRRPFLPDQMSKRGGKTASARYEAAGDRNVAASRRRGVESSPNLLQCHMSAPGTMPPSQRNCFSSETEDKADLMRSGADYSW